jgi:hypothetical protein
MRARMTCAVFAAATVLVLGALSALAAAAASGPKLPTSDPFYSYSGPLKHIAPGTVLKTRTIALAGVTGSEPKSAIQVLYRTTGELGQPTVTVATIIRPVSQTGPAKILSYQTAYDALGAQCDPSYTLQAGSSAYALGSEEEQIILGYVGAGDTIVTSDYEGEQLDWLAGQESGYAALDGIRAAESVLHADAASTPIGLIGYSGGSVPTDFASELAHAYAPKLDIVGAAEGGIPVDLFHNTTYVNGTPGWSGTIPASLVSLSRAFDVSLQPYLSAYGRRIASQVKRECITTFYGAYPGLTYEKLLKRKDQDLFRIPAFVKFTDHLIMGRSGTPKGPLLMAVGDSDGTGDGVMVTKDDEALAHAYCKRGVSVDFTVYKGDDHTQADLPFEQAAASFLSDRLDGKPVPDNCSSVGVGNSLAPLPVARSGP